MNTNPTLGGGDSIVKGWINFNGTGTPAINNSYNVSSITDLGTGKWQIDWQNAFTDANYAAVASSNAISSSGSDTAIVNKAAGSLEVWIVSSGALADVADISVIAIGTLA